METGLLEGTIVRFVGGVRIMDEEVFDSRKASDVGRFGKVVSPVEGSQYFWGRGNPVVNLCIEWLDADPTSTISKRYAITSSKFVEIVKDEIRK